jgi:hypothetical protein
MSLRELEIDGPWTASEIGHMRDAEAKKEIALLKIFKKGWSKIDLWSNIWLLI